MRPSSYEGRLQYASVSAYGFSRPAARFSACPMRGVAVKVGVGRMLGALPEFDRSMIRGRVMG